MISSSYFHHGCFTGSPERALVYLPGSEPWFPDGYLSAAMRCGSPDAALSKQELYLNKRERVAMLLRAGRWLSVVALEETKQIGKKAEAGRREEIGGRENQGLRGRRKQKRV
jgi:hypothetical protein